MADLISGNADPALKTRVYQGWDRHLCGPGAGPFARAVQPHVKFVSLDVTEHPQPNKRTVVSVHEAVVTEDFLNGGKKMHGGCTAFLIDICSTIPLLALNYESETLSVSLNLNVTYHAPAQLGTPLRITSTTVAVNRRVMTVRCETWDTSKQTLVATGTHLKMRSSDPREAKL